MSVWTMSSYYCRLLLASGSLQILIGSLWILLSLPLSASLSLSLHIAGLPSRFVASRPAVVKEAGAFPAACFGSYCQESNVFLNPW